MDPRRKDVRVVAQVDAFPGEESRTPAAAASLMGEGGTKLGARNKSGVASRDCGINPFAPLFFAFFATQRESATLRDRAVTSGGAV